MAELIIPALIGGAVAGGFTLLASGQQQSSADKRAKKQREAQAAAEKKTAAQAASAGEYWEQLNEKQMLLQSQENQIRLLSDVITSRDQQKPPQVFTLPPAKTYTVTERLNSVIDDYLKGIR